MNKVQEALLNVLGLEIDQEFEFHNKIYKFISFLSENENNENNINLCLARQDSIDRKWYEYDGNLLSIINNPDKIHPIKKPILDKVEKKYLENVLRPFKDRVNYIKLDVLSCNPNKAYVYVRIQSTMVDGDESMLFPLFKLGTIYKGMEIKKKYTLKELRLFEE